MPIKKIIKKRIVKKVKEVLDIKPKVKEVAITQEKTIIPIQVEEESALPQVENAINNELIETNKIYEQQIENKISEDLRLADQTVGDTVINTDLDSRRSLQSGAVGGGNDTKNNDSHIKIKFLILFLMAIIGYLIFSWQKSNSKTDYVAPTVTNNTMSPPVVDTAPVEKIVVVEPVMVVGSSKQNIATADPKIFKAPVNFKNFSYDASLGKRISLSGNCKDKYYTLLIFASGDDYRTDPGKARANRADLCPMNKQFTVDMDLKSINLKSGSYYIFIADQGDTGSWYNPR